MSCNGVWGFLKRKLGLSEPPGANLNVNNCTPESPPSTSLNYNPDPHTIAFSLEPKRCRLDGAITHLPSESIEPFATLCQLLTCSVCLEISSQANQCANGHLICLSCSAQLEQSAFTVSRACSCPVCRVSLSSWQNGSDNNNGGEYDDDEVSLGGTLPGLQRCLLAERLAAELPTACKFCKLQFPRRAIDKHRNFLCENRPVACPYGWLGCQWRGGAGNVSGHLKSCSLLNEEEKSWMRLAAKRMQLVGERTTARLQPWRGLMRLLQNRQHVHFGVRGLAGLRVILLPVVMTRLRRSGRDGSSENSNMAESNSYSSSVLCLPTGGKSSIWAQFELASKPLDKKVIEDRPECEATVEATYRATFRQCAKRPKSLRQPVDRERIITSNLIFYTLASLKCELSQDLEVFDCWHGFNESQRSGTLDSVPASRHTVTFRLANADSLPKFPEDHNSADVDSSLPCIEPLNAEGIFDRDTLNCSFLLAIDPKLFTQEREGKMRRIDAEPRTSNDSPHVVRPHVQLVLQTHAREDEEESVEEEEDDEEEDDDGADDDDEEERQTSEETTTEDLHSGSSRRAHEIATNVNATVHENDSPDTSSLSEQIAILRATARRRRARENT
ncbi:unnamed protein product [Schistocephalus solidus]|uniref:RING-type domain-containing protein n=1 Tax=Schistocephalus solidus TaxID=70667 RepID=A0A183SHR5_SCHSO|nr:unnamed protein product [Schistocephalus solidus]